MNGDGRPPQQHTTVFLFHCQLKTDPHTSPSSPTTSSSALSSCVRAVHTCDGTCSHAPYGGCRTCLLIKNCCKCKSTLFFWPAVSVVRKGLSTFPCGYNRNGVEIVKPQGAERTHRVEGHLSWTKPCQPGRAQQHKRRPMCGAAVLGLATHVLPVSWPLSLTEAWESITPYKEATPKRGSPSPQLEGPPTWREL